MLIANVTRLESKLRVAINSVDGEVEQDFYLYGSLNLFQTDPDSDFETATSGSVLIESVQEDNDESESNAETLFEFDFVNRTAGQYVFQSVVRGSTYQFVLTGGNSIVFNVINGNDLTTYFGTKQIPPPQQTFFQKYGVILIMVGYMCKYSSL